MRCSTIIKSLQNTLIVFQRGWGGFNHICGKSGGEGGYRFFFFFLKKWKIRGGGGSP